MGAGGSKPASNAAAASTTTDDDSTSATTRTTTSHKTKSTTSRDSSSSTSDRRHRSTTTDTSTVTSTPHTSFATSIQISAATETCVNGVCVPITASSTGQITGVSTPFSSTITTAPSTTLSTPSTTLATAVAATTTAGIAAPISHKSGISTGALAAAVVIPIVVLALIGAVLFFFFRRRRRQNVYRSSTLQNPSPGLSGAASIGEPSAPASADTEKHTYASNEKDVELSPIQPRGAAAVFHNNKRPLSVAPFPQRKSASIDIMPVADSGFTSQTPASATYTYTNSSSPDNYQQHYPSGTALISSSPSGSRNAAFEDPNTYSDPFDDSRSTMTSTPINHYSQPGAFPDTQPAAAAAAALASSNLPRTYNVALPTTPATKSQSSRTQQHSHLLTTALGLPPPQAPRTPGTDSDRQSTRSVGRGGEDTFDGEEYDGEPEEGVVGYATAARVVGGGAHATPAVAVGNAQSSGQRTSVGVVNVAGHVHAPSGSVSSARGGGGSPVL